MMDGRFDQHFAELFAASLAEGDSEGDRLPTWPLAVACLCGLVVMATGTLLT